MKPSPMDDNFQALARQHIRDFRIRNVPRDGGRVLEIGPEHDCWHNADTLDIKPGGTWRADITKRTPIPDSHYDVVLCMEVLEHVISPIDAITEIGRILRPSGVLLVSAPFNFRIHGPVPDLWRFSEHGWRVLLKDFDDVLIDALETPERPLMPIHYCAVARCNKTKDVDPWEVEFRWIT